MHTSVLLEECIYYLNLRDNSLIIDMTLGRAGHSAEVLKRINKGFLFAFDQDIEAIVESKKKLLSIGDSFELIHANFENVVEELEKREVNSVDGILFDLGVSSPQLDRGMRGFSFHKNAPLDMRMDQTQECTAYTVVNTYSEKKLAWIFKNYGEEKYASSIARKIVETRDIKNIETTFDLVNIIKQSVPFKYKNEKHPARKVFQALRIEVNHELEALENALRSSLDLIGLHGRICVITFHSLEDRICKKIFNEVSNIRKELSHMPVIPDEYIPKFKQIANIVPSDKEIHQNHRARSARLRVLERIKE